MREEISFGEERQRERKGFIRFPQREREREGARVVTVKLFAGMVFLFELTKLPLVLFSVKKFRHIT